MPANPMSRREMLVRSAATAAGLSLSISLSAATRKAQAKVDPAPNPKNDNTTLNALLSAEYDAIATYTAGAVIIAADSATPQATRDTVTAVAVHFRNQHTQHAAALRRLILEGARACTTFSSVRVALSAPLTLENQGFRPVCGRGGRGCCGRGRGGSSRRPRRRRGPARRGP